MVEVVRAGTRLFCSDRGSGTPVFFHTGGGGDHTMWESAGYLDALPGFRYLLYDHRGHGRSDKPTRLEQHRVEEYVADVVWVLDALAVRQAVLIGYSDGAYLVYAVAATHPERVAAVVGIGGVNHPAGSTGAWREATAREARREGFRSWLERMGASESEPPPRWLMDNLAATPTEMFALELQGWAGAPHEFTYFEKIRVPTLILCGEAENADGTAELAATTLSDGTAIVFPQFGHLQAFWRADVTGPVIREFLRSVS